MKIYLSKKFTILIFILITLLIALVYGSAIIYKAYCVNFNLYSIGQSPLSNELILKKQNLAEFWLKINVFLIKFLKISKTNLITSVSAFLVIPQSTLNFNSRSGELLLECTALTKNFIAYAGDIILIDFKITNQTSNIIDFSANFTSTPMTMSIFLQKIQCFCYSKIRLEPFANLNLPVLLYIDPELSFELTKKLPETARIITLNYIFFIQTN